MALAVNFCTGCTFVSKSEKIETLKLGIIAFYLLHIFVLKTMDFDTKVQPVQKFTANHGKR